MAWPRVFRYIHHLWHKPNSEMAFAPRFTRLYCSFGLISFVGIISILICLNIWFPTIIGQARLHIINVISPVLSTIHKASAWTLEKVSPAPLNTTHVPAADVDQLIYDLTFLRKENEQLRALLQLPQPSNKAALTSEVICISLDGHQNSFVIRSAPELKIIANMPVIDTRGLVGRIKTVSNNLARVVTIADPNFRVPILVGSNQLHGIAAGGSPETMRILYLSHPNEVRVGDPVVTSGEGGIFPAGIPVGIVSEVAPSLVITNAVSLKHLRFVKLLEPSYNQSLEEATPAHPQ